MPVLGSYVLSFVFIATYWNNHHHLFLATERVSGGVLWANMGLLFCLSLVPLGTAWMGETHFAPVPTAVYSAILLMSALAYWVLQSAILAIVCALWVPLVSAALCGLVDVIWLIPDRRIERALAARGESGE